MDDRRWTMAVLPSSILLRYRTITLDVITASRYYFIMIKSFCNGDIERFFARYTSQRLPTTIHRVAQRKLAILDAADELVDLRVPPGNRLEQLTGKHSGQYSIRINDQWRICFEWRNGDAYEVEIVDYH